MIGWAPSCLDLIDVEHSRVSSQHQFENPQGSGIFRGLGEFHFNELRNLQEKIQKTFKKTTNLIRSSSHHRVIWRLLQLGPNLTKMWSKISILDHWGDLLPSLLSMRESIIWLMLTNPRFVLKDIRIGMINRLKYIRLITKTVFIGAYCKYVTISTRTVNTHSKYTRNHPSNAIVLSWITNPWLIIFIGLHRTFLGIGKRWLVGRKLSSKNEKPENVSGKTPR